MRGLLLLTALALSAGPAGAACPLPALPGNGSFSGNERAPSPQYLFGRAVYLMTATELATAGIPNGTVPSGIGWTFSTPPSSAATGSLKIYLQNTTDTVNTKSTTWSTAISGMTLVHDSAAATIPAATAQWGVTFEGGSSFAYTGSALYVAFDWQWPGPIVAASVACTTTLAGGINGAQSNSAPPSTTSASSSRPETRLVADIGVDLGVETVVAFGKLPIPFVGPQVVKAALRNRGAAASNVPVTLEITGAETFSTTQIVPQLDACGAVTIVSFAPFTPGAIGADTVTVSIPDDSVGNNNSLSKPVEQAQSEYSYRYPGSIATGGLGFSGSTGAIVGRFTTTRSATITNVTLDFYSASATTYRIAIYPDAAGTPGLTPLYLDTTDRTVPAGGFVSIALPSPVAVGPGDFHVGLHQTNTTSAGLAYEKEQPLRTGAFFSANTLPPSSWSDLAPAYSTKLDIGVTLAQCTVAADCDDGNACTDDACSGTTCAHTNNGSACDDGNPCTVGDVCVSGACNAGAPAPPPAEVGDSVRVTRLPGGSVGRIAWNDPPGPYDVYRGVVTGSWTYNQSCLDAGAAGPTDDGAMPTTRQSFYYLVARRTSCGESILGRDSQGAAEPNQSPCP